MCWPLVVDVPVIISDKLQQSFVESVEVPQLPFIDIVVGFVASQRQGSQCKLFRRPDFGQVQFLDGTRPSLCNDRAGWSRQFSLEVQQVQFLPHCGRPCGLAGRPGVPAKPGGASDSVHRQSWVVEAVKGVLAVFLDFSRSSGLSRS